MENNKLVALVTGGSRGIGRACAIELAKAGVDVVINYAGNEAAANETLAELKALGSNAKAYKFNVADAQLCEENIKAIIEEYGRIDILVNNAGVSERTPFMEYTEDTYEQAGFKLITIGMR